MGPIPPDNQISKRDGRRSDFGDVFGPSLGLFPGPESPMVVVTNGNGSAQLFISNDYETMNALGVSQLGQMTAGSYMYIGPQGIVHGTTITILNAARKYLKWIQRMKDWVDPLYHIWSWRMSGAQAKAAVIAGAVCIIAEIDPAPAKEET